MTDIVPVLGVLAGAIAVADTVPYLRDITRGSTRPHRGTWFIWGVLAVVVCLSQRADGASWSLIMVAAQAALTSVIFLLAIRHGEGGVSPADLIGAAMMVPKTYRDPESETLVTFAFATVAGALAAGAVGALDVSLLLYPVYFCLANAAIAVLIVHRRRALS